MATITAITRALPWETALQRRSRTGRRRGTVPWTASGTILLAAIAAILAVYWRTAIGHGGVWSESETFNHCFLILPICGYLVWQRWDDLKRLTPRPAALGLVPLAGASALWLVSNTAGVLIGEQVAVVVMCQAAVLTVLGWRVSWALIFPLCFLFFAVPFGTSLIPFFQDVTAQLGGPAAAVHRHSGLYRGALPGDSDRAVRGG